MAKLGVRLRQMVDLRVAVEKMGLLGVVEMGLGGKEVLFVWMSCY